MTIDDKKERLEKSPFLFDSTIFDPSVFDTGLYYPNGLPIPDRLEVSPDFLTGAYAIGPFIETPYKIDNGLSNIHEPISEHEKKIRELELSVSELKELWHEKWEKRRETKTKKRKSKSVEKQLRRDIEELKKIVTTYEPEWRFTKDMHAKEANDTSKE